MQVITSPNGKNNSSSRGSSEPTGTQRTEPSAEYVPPSTRTATGSLPSRSRSSYSWGNDGQAAGLQGADKLICTASNAAAQRAAQATPQVRACRQYLGCMLGYLCVCPHGGVGCSTHGWTQPAYITDIMPLQLCLRAFQIVTCTLSGGACC
jgi:hypothetical protein